MTITARYGTWPSPVTAELLVADAVRLSSPQRDGADAYWREGRPHEAGREVIVRRRANSEVRDVLPAGFSARTLVHEYGSRCFVVREGTVYFTNFDDQRLYRLDPGDGPRPITPEPPTPRAWRYADPVLSNDGATLVCVRERHTDAGVENDLVAVRTDGVGAPRVLAAGYDFVASPALSRDGRRLAWICWDHPSMPWDATQLHEAETRRRVGRGLDPGRRGGPGRVRPAARLRPRRDPPLHLGPLGVVEPLRRGRRRGPRPGPARGRVRRPRVVHGVDVRRARRRHARGGVVTGRDRSPRGARARRSPGRGPRRRQRLRRARRRERTRPRPGGARPPPRRRWWRSTWPRARRTSCAPPRPRSWTRPTSRSPRTWSSPPRAGCAPTRCTTRRPTPTWSRRPARCPRSS